MIGSQISQQNEWDECYDYTLWFLLTNFSPSLKTTTSLCGIHISKGKDIICPSGI